MFSNAYPTIVASYLYVPLTLDQKPLSRFNAKSFKLTASLYILIVIVRFKLLISRFIKLNCIFGIFFLFICHPVKKKKEKSLTLLGAMLFLGVFYYWIFISVFRLPTTREFGERTAESGPVHTRLWI